MAGVPPMGGGESTAATVRSDPGPSLRGGRLWRARSRFLLRSARLLSRYPAVTLRFPEGLRAATQAMEEAVVREYQRSPSSTAQVGGARIHLNPRNTLAENASMVIARWYEPGVSEVVSPLCPPGGRVVDVGANVGWYTFLAASRVGPGGLVLGFEPDPENFQLLSTSLAENPRSQVRIFPQCLSDHVGEERLFLSDTAASYHSIAQPVGTRWLTVPATTLDTVVQEHHLGSLDLVKVDVEGGEPKVLRGAREVLRSGVIRNLTLEWRPESWTGEEELWRDVTDRFDVYHIQNSPRLLTRIDAPTVARVSAAAIAAGRHGRDLYLARKPG